IAARLRPYHGRTAAYEPRQYQRPGALARRQQGLAQPLPNSAAGAKVVTIDDRQPEAAGWHGMPERLPILMEGDLDARYARLPGQLGDHRCRRMTIARSGRSEQHHAVARPARVLDERPAPFGIKPDQRF